MDVARAMAVFSTVATLGSFSKAAARLALPAATVTHIVQELERELGTRLLHRTTRKVTLTDDGTLYQERCLRLLADIDDAQALFSHARTKPRGVVRVDLPERLARLSIIPALPEFFDLYPDVQVRLAASDRFVDLVGEGVDCAVRGGPLNDTSLIARRVGIINFVTAAAPSYLARFGLPRHPNDLARHRCVNYFSAKTGKVYDWDFNRDGERIEVPMPGVIALNDSNAYVQAGLAGLGIIQMTDYLLTRHVQDGRMVQVLPDWVSDPLPVHIVYPQNRHMSAKVRVFVEWVAELFANHPQMRLGPRPSFAAQAAEPA